MRSLTINHGTFNIDFEQFQFGLDLNRKEELTA